MSPAEKHLGRLTAMPSNDKQIFNDPEVKGDHRKYEYICWKTGTRPEDGVRYTAFSSFVARKQFASAFNLTMDEVMARKTS